MIWGDGDCFEGNWADGAKNGFGTYTREKEGAFIYIGNYKNDKKDG